MQKQENARQEIHMDTPKYCFVCSVVSDSMTVLPFCIHQQTFLVFLKLRPGNKRLELIFFFSLHPFVYFGFLKYFGTLLELGNLSAFPSAFAICCVYKLRLY